MNGKNIIPFTDFIQSGSSLIFSAGTLAPGIHIVILEVKLKEVWFHDFIVLNATAPALYTFLTVGDYFNVRHGTIVNVNASLSYDPAGELAFSQRLDLISEWTFGIIPNGDSYAEVYNMVDKNLSSISHIYKIKRGNVNVLKVNSSYFPINSFGVAVFKMTRGSRTSTVFQVFKFAKSDNVLSASVRYGNETFIAVLNVCTR